MIRMRNLLGFVLFGAVLRTSPVLGVNCRDVQSVVSAQKNCFTREGIKIYIPTNIDYRHMGDYLQKAASVSDLSKTCSNLDAYKRIIACVLDVSRECLQLVDMSQYLASNKQLTDSMDYACANLKDYDYQCANNKIEAWFKCAKQREMDYVRSNPGLTRKEIMCKAYQFTYECAKEKVRACGQRTLDIQMIVTRDQVPKICGYVLPVSVLQTSPVHAVNCRDAQNIVHAQKNCFYREGKTIEIPANLDPSHIGNYLQKAASVSDLKKTCSSVDAYKRILVCVMDVSRKCLQLADLSQYLPSDEQMTDSLDYACENLREYNYQCANTKIKAIFNCGKEREMDYVRSNRGLIKEKIMCQAFKFVYECTEEKVRACGQRTLDIQMTLTRDQVPKACAYVLPSEEGTNPRYVLHINTKQKHASSGSTTKVHTGTVLILSAIIGSIMMM